jgi:hypothetical protein
MATANQIAAASARPRKSTGGNVIDRVGNLGDVTYEACEGRRAARALARQAPDLAEVIGLTLPCAAATLPARVGREAADFLLDAVAHDRNARQVAEGMAPMELEAARDELKARVKDR